MKILFCNYEYPPIGGGGGVINALLAEELAKTHDVTVLTSQAMDLPSQSTEKGVEIIRTPVFFRRQLAAANFPSMLAFLPMASRSGKKLLQQQKFDIINTHFVLPTGPVGDALSRFGKIPNVLSVHGGDLYDPSKFSSPHRHLLLRLWIKKLLGRAEHVVGQSKNTVENIHKYYTSDLDVSRIPLGINRPEKIIGNRKQHGFDSDGIILVTVGRLVARKATHQLLTMLAEMARPNVYLLVVGSGPQEEPLKIKAKELGIEDKVVFKGQVTETEKIQLLDISDIFVSTSQHEGFGLVYLEAMAASLPVICYDYGGQTDFLENDKTGYVVPLNELDSFKRDCLKLIENKEKRHSMSLFNKDRVESLYIDHCAAQYEALFEKVIKLHKDNIK